MLDKPHFEKLFPANKQFFYHNGCRLKFLRTTSQIHLDNDPNGRKIHKQAFKEICSLIDEKIIRNDEFVSFKMIFQSYQLKVFAALKTRPYIKQEAVRQKIMDRFSNKVSISVIKQADHPETYEILHRHSRELPDFDTIRKLEQIENEEKLLR
jgi:hypothetical protein